MVCSNVEFLIIVRTAVIFAARMTRWARILLTRIFFLLAFDWTIEPHYYTYPVAPSADVTVMSQWWSRFWKLWKIMRLNRSILILLFFIFNWGVIFILIIKENNCFFFFCLIQMRNTQCDCCRRADDERMKKETIRKKIIELSSVPIACTDLDISLLHQLNKKLFFTVVRRCR